AGAARAGFARGRRAPPGRPGLGRGGNHPPLALDSLERAAPPVLKPHPRPDHEVLDGAGREDLPWTRLAGDARADVDGDAPDVVAHAHALAGVHARAHLEAERADGISNGEPAADASRRAVEEGQEAVAGGRDLASAEVCNLTPHQRIVSYEQITPSPVAEAGCLLRRADDVGEQHGREDAIVLQRRVRAGDELLHGREDPIDVAVEIEV